jgi:surface antigen
MPGCVSKSIRRVCAVSLLVFASLGLAARGSGSSKTTTTPTTTTAMTASLVGRSATVALTPETAETLKHHEMTVSAVAPATAHTTWAFPVSRGHIVTSTLTGTVEGTGGLILSHGGHSVRLTNFIVETSSRRLTALLVGVRRNIVNLNLSFLTRATGSNGVLFGRDIELPLAAPAATTAKQRAEPERVQGR